MIIDTAFAAQSRARCAPAECDRRPGCWIEAGAPGAKENYNKAARCNACDGLIQIKNWLPPNVAVRTQDGI